VTEKDERGWQPGFLLIGHDVTIAVIFPQLTGYGAHVKVNIAVK